MHFPLALRHGVGTLAGLGVALTVGFADSALAQDPGASDGTALALQQVQRLDLRPVYEIVYFSSVNSSGRSSGTVAVVKNNSSETCEIEVAWFFGRTGGVACQTSVVVDPNTWARYCTRSISGQHLIGACDAICPGELTFTEGFGRVSVAEPCERSTAVHAMQYYSPGDIVGPDIQGTRTLNVVRLPPGRTQGD